jgi:hypothetical protein
LEISAYSEPPGGAGWLSWTDMVRPISPFPRDWIRRRGEGKTESRQGRKTVAEQAPGTGVGEAS